MMFAEDTNGQDTSGRAWFMPSAQYCTPLSKETASTTTVPMTVLSPELNRATISYTPWHHYDLQLELSLMTLDESHASPVPEQNDYPQVPDQTFTLLPLFNTTGLGPPTFLPPQPAPIPFAAAPLAPPAHDTGPSPPIISSVPTYMHQPGPEPIVASSYESSGTRQKKEKKATSIKRKLNPRFQCLHPGCNLNLGEARALNRHIWAAHREWAQENRVVRSEEMACPFPGCKHRGRKDNVLRHFKTKHKSI
ncbi:hypothetical protein B0T21DRAFT_162128 [Apiosordaria backusii]|uniref:C2H2-type domain-containing protein n=1 Tax=Apiosordaria backusii TaxID=314023 RepID=A0AA40EGA2_9PEZI|nr:hypothetical protein B0T21DRAFT_162128 [Apiosordaria backusii]